MDSVQAKQLINDLHEAIAPTDSVQHTALEKLERTLDKMFVIRGNVKMLKESSIERGYNHEITTAFANALFQSVD